MLKTVYFDLGNVLFFFSHEKMFNQMSECTGIPLPEIKSFLLENRVQEDYESGRIGSPELFQLFKLKSVKPFTLPDLLDAISNIFTPNTKVWKVVEKLKENGIQLVILSNTNECHYDRVYSQYPILKLFEKKVLSYEVGAMKPDPRIYEKALSFANCSPSECFFTDDLEENVLSARRAGLDSEIFTDEKKLAAHLIQRGCTFLNEN